MNKTDLLLALGFACLGAYLGVSVLDQAGTLFFYQNFTPEVVYSACGYGFHHPAVSPPKLLAFLMRETQSFDCSDLASPISLGPPGYFSLLQLYFTWVVALIWRLSSVSYHNLWPLVAVMVGAYTSGCYVLLRQFFTRSHATVGAFFLSVSPIALPLVVSLRDYSKAPFFIWTIVFLIAAIRARRLPAILGWAAASGLTVGLGCGFRADLVIMLPFSLVTLLIAFEARLFLSRLLAAILMTVVVVATSYPVLSHGKGGTYGSIIIQGMSDPFRDHLKLAPAPYSFGARYSDELVFSSIAADARVNDPEWDRKEAEPIYGVSRATTLSGPSWQKFFPYFLGDFVIQAFKSAGFILGYPVLAAADMPPDPGYPVMDGPPASLVMAPVYSLLAQHWLPWLGIVGIFVFLWRVWVQSRQDALGLMALLGALLTYPVVQFSVRHVFHLEFVWVCAFLALSRLPFEFPQLRRSGVSFPLIAGACAALVMAASYAALQYQQRMLSGAFAQLLANPRQALSAGVSSGGPVHIPLPVPDRYAGLVTAKPDSMTPAIASIGLQWDVRSAADRLMLTARGPTCSGEAVLALQYTKSPDVWQPFGQRIDIELDGRGEGTHVLFPAFYRPTQYLSAVDITGVPAGCAIALDRVTGPTVFPALMTAVLQPDWQAQRLYHGYGSF